MKGGTPVHRMDADFGTETDHWRGGINHNSTLQLTMGLPMVSFFFGGVGKYLRSLYGSWQEYVGHGTV